MVFVIVVFWIVGCAIASMHLRDTNIFCSHFSNSQRGCYFLSGFFSLLRQIFLFIDGWFFFEIDFLKYYEGNNNTLRSYECFSVISGLLLLGTFVVDIYLLSTLNEHSADKEEV
jgi:hypothetical protein